MAIAVAYANFQKTFRGNMHQDPPLSRFWCLSCLKLTLPKKITLEKVTKISVPSLKKNSEYDPDMKHFQKAYLRLFPGLNVSAFS